MRQTVRVAALGASLLAALVVAALPGTTIASSSPARLAAPVAPEAPPNSQSEALTPVLVPIRMEELLSTYRALPAGEGSPSVPSSEPALTSVLEDAQLVSVYGHPGVCTMGELGCHADPLEALQVARDLAAQYDALNGDRETQAALHLIVDVAQANPGDDGRYLEQMPLEDIQTWVDLAREQDVVLFLDVQIGWSEVLHDVMRLHPFLEQPHVQLAVDPEFNTKSEGIAPGQVLGELRASDIDRVQHYLAGIVEAKGIPPKVLVLHQFREDMLPDAADIQSVPEVEVTIDMDGWGGPFPKSENYVEYALAPYAERPAIKLFYKWDEPMMTPADVMALPTPPDYVIYQ